MAITRAQIAKQLLANGGNVLGPLGEQDLTNQLSPGTISRVVPNIGRGLAFILSGGLSGGVSAVAKELAEQKIIDELSKKSGDIVRPRIQTKMIQRDNMLRGTGGYQSDFAQDSDFMGGRGTAAEMGSFADGGNVVGGEFDFESARQMYGLGKLVKKVTRTVKKIAKSPIGKAALTAAAVYYAPGIGIKAQFGSGLSGLQAAGVAAKSKLGNFFMGPQFVDTGGKVFRSGGLFSKIPGASLLSQIPGGGVTAAIAGTSLLAGLLTPEQEEEAEELSRGEGIDIEAARRSILERAQGNIAGDLRARRFRAEGGSMKEPVAKKTMPLLDMDGQEMDLRAEGGFVPIGRMEKADDVPARLSKNEFVFTADAVRNAGDGNVDKGAEVMYNMMKNLEAGGEVSEESQGLQGARKMFQTSQRLEEVL